MSKLLKAIRYAKQKHKGQIRKNNGQDYFMAHCLKLLSYVACDKTYGKDRDAGIIILCHDVVEDCSKSDSDKDRAVTYGEIKFSFGHAVQEGVYELTDEYTKERYPNDNRATRKMAEHTRLSGISDRSKALKLHDIRANLEDYISDGDWNTTLAKELRHLAETLCTQDTRGSANKCIKLANTIIEHKK